MKKLYACRTEKEMYSDIEYSDEVEILENRFAFDGGFLHRKLHNIQFEATFVNNKVIEVKVDDEDKSLFDIFDKERFLKKAKIYAQDILDDKEVGEELPRDLAPKYLVNGRNWVYFK